MSSYDISLASLASEDSLTSIMQNLCTTYGPCLEEQDPAVRVPLGELLDRWQRFTRSGVLKKRDAIAGAAHKESFASARLAAREGRLTTATLKCCSLQSCAARELHSGHFKRCSACHITVYCSREHQLEDWRAHKPACKAARKAAAAEGGGAA
jgi:hypothetical protein